MDKSVCGSNISAANIILVKTVFYLETPKRFNFRNTVMSHGWYDLPPFELDDNTGSLNYTFRPRGSRDAVSASITAEPGRIRTEVHGEVFRAGEVKSAIVHVLRMDDDFEGFYRTLSGERRFRWVRRLCAGRLLRSATVFEDLVKTICTTNCSWGLTKKMITNLVEKLGPSSASGRRAFPAAEAMAACSDTFYRDEIRAGYRSAYIRELAEAVAAGDIDPESWMTSDLPTQDLKKEMMRIKGVGEYAAEHMLRLVGRYDGLALDSWVREQFYKKHRGGEQCGDKIIHEFYESYGEWKGLALWCDVTEDWFQV